MKASSGAGVPRERKRVVGHDIIEQSVHLNTLPDRIRAADMETAS